MLRADLLHWLITAFFVLIAIRVPLAIGINKELRTKHPDIWEAFGRPGTLNLDPSYSKKEWKLYLYMMTRKYRGLGNQKLNRLGDVGLACDVVIMTIFMYWTITAPFR